MRLALSAVLALSAAASAAIPMEASKTVKAPTPSQAVAALISHQPPKGWQVEEYANGGGADPVVAFVDGLDRIAVRVFGAPGSGYKNPASFLSGPAASTMGRKPEKVGSVTAAGRQLALYRRGFPINLGDPHSPSGPASLGREVFCILPASGGRFIVLSYARESPAPDMDQRGEKAWGAFLRTVKLAGRKT
ncbi:MAG: hypothetical protein PHS14_02780 [Elusimicrobia bacterium]|nr:hypothetical protein [Elusimicrobiota bacterium]